MVTTYYKFSFTYKYKHVYLHTYTITRNKNYIQVHMSHTLHYNFQIKIVLKNGINLLIYTYINFHTFTTYINHKYLHHSPQMHTYSYTTKHLSLKNKYLNYNSYSVTTFCITLESLEYTPKKHTHLRSPRYYLLPSDQPNHPSCIHKSSNLIGNG